MTGTGVTEELLDQVARELCKADGKVWWTEKVPNIYHTQARALAQLVTQPSKLAPGELAEAIDAYLEFSVWDDPLHWREGLIGYLRIAALWGRSR